MRQAVLAVVLSTAFIFATPVPVVLAMDADALKGDTNTKRSCDTIIRNISRTKKKIEAADYKLAELQVDEQDASGDKLERVRAKIKQQKAKIRELKDDLREWERELAKNC
jgi:peptidoglycan hydrolase CwlO-like protein